MANRSYKSILHNKKELHEDHTTHVEEIKEEQATEAADTTVEKISEEKNVEEFRRRLNENCTLTEEDLRP